AGDGGARRCVGRVGCGGARGLSAAIESPTHNGSITLKRQTVIIPCCNRHDIAKTRRRSGVAVDSLGSPCGNGAVTPKGQITFMLSSSHRDGNNVSQPGWRGHFLSSETPFDNCALPPKREAPA